MSAGRIILWRHGQTDYNLQMRVQGQIDIPLNEVGLAQAKRAAEQIATIPIAKIICSPLSRAQDTARTLGELVNLDPEIDDRLLERGFGVFEGYTHQMMVDEFPNWYQQWRESGECGEAGIEPIRDMAERLRLAVLEHAATLGGEDTLVVVSHGSALSRATAALLGLDPEDAHWLRGLDNCAWSVLVEGRHTPWRLAGHNQSCWPGADAIASQA